MQKERRGGGGHALLVVIVPVNFFFFSSRRRHTRLQGDWSSDVCSSDLYLLPGNHDDRDALRTAFPEHTWLRSEGFIQYAVDIGALRLIALDTVVPDHSEEIGRASCRERV